MKQIVLRAWDFPGLSVTALILFFFSFAIYAWWTYRKVNKAMYEEASLIPLEDAPKMRKKYE